MPTSNTAVKVGEGSKKRILRWMQKTQRKTAVVKLGKQHYLCEIHKEFTAWENWEYDELRVYKITAPVDLAELPK